MIETIENLEKSSSQSCIFIKKKGLNNRKRQNEYVDEEDPTEIKKLQKTNIPNPLKQYSKAPGFKTHTFNSDNENEDITVTFKSSKSENREGPKDMGATMESQIDTDINLDAQAIFQKSLDINKTLKGKKDDKIYRGINNYSHYIEKKDSIMGNAASNMVRNGPMRAPAFIRSTTRWDYQPDLCKDYQETGYCVFGDSCKFGHDRTDYKFGWQLEQEWNEGKYGQEDEESKKYEILAEILLNERDENGNEMNKKDGQHHDAAEDEEELPFRCLICRRSFKEPVVTKCKHYFCKTCAIKRYKTNTRCFVCGNQTHGLFAPAKEITARLKAKAEKEKIKNGDKNEEGSDTNSEASENDITGKKPRFTSKNMIETKPRKSFLKSNYSSDSN